MRTDVEYADYQARQKTNEKPSPTLLHSIFSALLLVQTVSSHPSGAARYPSGRPARFASHVTVNTPARSFSHGVGDPLPSAGRRVGQPRPPRGRQPYQRQGGGGYPRVKPAIPFSDEERPRGGSGTDYNPSPWHLNSFQEIPIAVLPPSPYKVDSPDPESLWPQGLFLPPNPPHVFGRRADGSRGLQESSDPHDPYLLEGSEAVAAVHRAKAHGLYFFHDIPHIQSLLENQQLRIDNGLEPHRIGSIRHTWPYNRP